MAIPSTRPSRRLVLRNARVQQHLALVAPIASHYALRSAESHEDLHQVGRLGLIRAAELYDSRQAVPFSAYARRHVRGAILHYLRDTAPLVREPRRLQERRLQLKQQQRQLGARLGRDPSLEELQQSLAWSDPQWRDLALPSGAWQQAWMEQLSLNQELINQCDAEAEHQRAARVRRELARLDSRQRQIIAAVLLQGQSLRAVARERGMSLTSVHRLLQQGLSQLRTRLTGPSDDPGC